jgi:hypothetical protein
VPPTKPRIWMSFVIISGDIIKPLVGHLRREQFFLNKFSLSASVFYEVNFGSENYSNNIISTSLGFSF